jgi:polyhydroxyalkanoate synthesis repressor PhaR
MQTSVQSSTAEPLSTASRECNKRLVLQRNIVLNCCCLSRDCATLMLNKTDPSAANKDPAADKREPVVVKKYANRRLYNTDTSTYVTLDDLAAMVKSGRDFVVFDAKTGDDLTHAVLTQIIVEQESRMGTQTLLPIPFLRQLIRFYGDNVEKLVPSYLQFSLDLLTKEQERFRKTFAGAFTPAGAFEAYQEQARKNLAMFEQAMTMFSPFGHAKPTGTAPAKPGEDAKDKPEPAKSAPKTDDLGELRVQLATMQAKLEQLSRDRD